MSIWQAYFAATNYYSEKYLIFVIHMKDQFRKRMLNEEIIPIKEIAISLIPFQKYCEARIG